MAPTPRTRNDSVGILCRRQCNVQGRCRRQTSRGDVEKRKELQLIQQSDLRWNACLIKQASKAPPETVSPHRAPRHGQLRRARTTQARAKPRMLVSIDLHNCRIRPSASSMPDTSSSLHKPRMISTSRSHPVATTSTRAHTHTECSGGVMYTYVCHVGRYVRGVILRHHTRHDVHSAGNTTSGLSSSSDANADSTKSSCNSVPP